MKHLNPYNPISDYSIPDYSVKDYFKTTAGIDKLIEVFVNFFNNLGLKCKKINMNSGTYIVSDKQERIKFFQRLIFFKYRYEDSNNTIVFNLYEKLPEDIANFIRYVFYIDDIIRKPSVFEIDINTVDHYITLLTKENYDDFILKITSKKYNI